MTAKELLRQITIIIDKKFEKISKRLDAYLKGQEKLHKRQENILAGINEITTNMATKADIQALGKTIDAYIEIISIYKDKQRELEKKIEAILEYLGIHDD